METINDIKQINTSTKEGQYLMAALAKITTESQTDKTPYEVLKQLDELKSKMSFDVGVHKFELELKDLINRNSMENGCDTPDFILARYMMRCLEAFNEATNARDGWFDYKPFGKSKRGGNS